MSAAKKTDSAGKGPLDEQAPVTVTDASEEAATSAEGQAVAAMEESADFTYAVGERTVSFALDESIYNRDAIYGTSYLFIEKCFVFLTRPGDNMLGVRLRSRTEATEQELEEIAGEFVNELLNQMVRHQVGESTARIREYYMARAFFASDTQTTIDDLLAELDDEELEEAPLEIAVPWEETDA